MKKSFMNNLKNFVDSNVRHRIDKVTNNSGNNTNSDLSNDNLTLVERHFDDLHQFCVETEKKISSLLQSIHISAAQLGNYTQNVQAGFNNLSHNLAQQAANITSSNNSATNSYPRNADGSHKNSPTAEPSSGNSSRHSPCDRSATLVQKQHVIPAQVHYELDANIPTELSYDTLQKFKRLPVVKLYKSLCKSSNKLKQDSILATTLTYCSKMQAQLTNLYLVHEQMIDTQCLAPIQQMLELDIPNVLKLKKLYVKAHNDLDSARTKYNGANQKQQQMQSGQSNNTSYLVVQNSSHQSNINKLELLKNELDESVARFEQAKDIYEAELFAFVCREPELVNMLKLFYQLQSSYHQQVISIIQNSLPALEVALDRTPRKFVFGTPLSEHIRCTGRQISPVIELCVHFLHAQGLKEEGLFRVPGSSMKIKKLKNGINAMFLTFMSLNELETDRQRQSGHSCIVSLYDLFKSAVGQPPLKEQPLDPPPLQNSVLRSSLAVDDSPMSHTNYLTSPDSQRDSTNGDYIMDVHSIAGLLKLYMRELPEPLFTHALYDDWLDCVSKHESNEQRLALLSEVMKRLPNANYANLKHLVRFLNELTHHQERNKMTSTNLAIAMAPSLIWPRRTAEKNQNSVVDPNSDSSQTLNSQMCSFGLSASQHAMLLDALIINADALFPEQVDFELSEFNDLTLKSDAAARSMAKRIGRNVKSTSPTGLSTASSSSFSSSASNSAVSPTLVKGHSRKGGSMEGLLGGVVYQEVKSTLQTNMSTRSIGRPASVQVSRDEYSNLRREYMKGSLLSAASTKPDSPDRGTNNVADPRSSSRSSHKPPAPPVPPPTSIRHQQERMRQSALSKSPDPENSTVQKPRPVSLRGTGTIDRPHTNNNQASARPSVPPPERPITKTTMIMNSDSELNIKDDRKASQEGSLRNATSQVRSGAKDQIGLERSHVVRLDEPAKLSNPSGVATVISPDGVSTNDDSSFEDSDEDHIQADQSRGGDTSRPLVDIKSNTRTDLAEGLERETSEMNDERHNEVHPVVLPPKPPTKPPRSTSPRLTQSTPL